MNSSHNTLWTTDEGGGGGVPLSSSATNLTLMTTVATLSTSHTEGGYDYEFVDGSDSRYECPICLHCLRDPVLTTCGHRFCSGCIHQWVVQQDGKCPVDSVSLSPDKIFPDNYTRREIMACKAKCPRCGVVLPISDLEKHMEVDGSCLGAISDGSNGAVGSPLGIGALECPFKDVGCTVNFREDQREKHLEKEVHKHLQLLRTAYSRLRAFSTSRTNLEYPPHLDYSRQDSRESAALGLDESQCLDDYQFRRQRSWDSVRFARKQIRPTPSRLLQSSSGSHAWLPVSEESLCHQQHPHPHTSTSLPQYHSSSSQKHDDGGSPEKAKLNGQSSPGGSGLDPHLQDIFQRLVLLEQKDREKQIKIDKLEAELHSVLNLFSSTTQIIRDFTARYCNGVYVWKLRNLRRLCLEMRRDPNRRTHSPGFYTDTFGYKLCLTFGVTSPSLTTSAGGYSNAPVDVPLEKDEDSFVSIHVHFMQGENDDTLQWPFEGDMKLMIIHPTIPEDSIIEDMSARPEALAFQKPTLPRNPKGFGFHEFCPLHKIFANGFVKDDTLVFKVLAKASGIGFAFTREDSLEKQMHHPVL